MKVMKHATGISILMLLLLAIPNAWAWDADSALSLGAFGTVGAAYGSKRDVEYRRSIDQRKGVVGDEVTLGLDTVFGAQVNAALGDHAEAVVQAVSRQDVDGSWDPKISWAYLRYSPNEDLDLRVGRLGLDLLLFSDSRLVGYSYLPIRPAPEVLGLISIQELEGGDLQWRQRLGNGVTTLKLYAGTSRGQFSRNGMVFDQAKANFGAIVGEYAIDGLQLRAWLGRAHLLDNGAVEPLLTAFRGTGTAYGRALADQLQLRGVDYDYAAVAGAYTNGPFQLQSALVRMGTKEDKLALPTFQGAFLIAGYRTGNLTPYFTYTWANSKPHEMLTDNSGSRVSAALARTAQMVVDGVQVSQRTLGLGLRYDIAPNVDLKFQIDRVDAGKTRLVQDLAHPNQSPGEFSVFGIALDFVF
jgi:hypothetical protein